MDKSDSIGKDIAKKVWISLFPPLPKGSLVKIRNRAYKKGYYIGKIYSTRHNFSKRTERDWGYVIVHPRGGGFTAWVRPESIMEVIRYGKE